MELTRTRYLMEILFYNREQFKFRKSQRGRGILGNFTREISETLRISGKRKNNNKKTNNKSYECT